MEINGFAIPSESNEKFLKTVYTVLWEEMKFVFLGHLSRPLDAALMEEFSEPDILFLPIGGGHFLEPDVAAKMAQDDAASDPPPRWPRMNLLAPCPLRLPRWPRTTRPARPHDGSGRRCIHARHGSR